ncbi:perlucin-like isoform X2 [Mizuhopecten yessoensis]|uniref:perlucin-like isoform X2 n=1 Tax=Mizuhopecten yessoensis TaxID=6573 RepID=UPI000B45E63B|nr:perlucin-like isoform X2 [Mizuhopecten yessoensis]
MAFIITLTLLLTLTTFCVAECPDGFVKHGGSCYHVVRIKATWPESDIYCHAVDADLATIETQDEQHFIEGHLITNAGAYDPARFWIGGNDIAEEGTWVWLKSKTPISHQTYSNWKDGIALPLSARENCLELSQRYHWQWNDNNCDDHYFFVCEKDAYKDGGIVIG